MNTLTLLSQKKIPVNNISFRTYMASELKFLFVRNYTYSLDSGMWQSGRPKSWPMIKQHVVFTTSQYCSILLCSSADTGTLKDGNQLSPQVIICWNSSWTHLNISECLIEMSECQSPYVLLFWEESPETKINTQTFISFKISLCALACMPVCVLVCVFRAFLPNLCNRGRRLPLYSPLPFQIVFKIMQFSRNLMFASGFFLNLEMEFPPDVENRPFPPT